MAKGEKRRDRLNISLNENIIAELDRRCAETGCPRSVYIAMALKAKWQQEDQIKQMPMMYGALSRVAQVIEECKSDPAMLEKLKSDPKLLEYLAHLPD